MSRLQDFRREKGLSQVEFSKATNISVRSIQDLEQGRVSISNVHLSTLIEFGHVLGVPFVELLEDENFRRRVAQQCAAVRKSGAPEPAQH